MKINVAVIVILTAAIIGVLFFRGRARHEAVEVVGESRPVVCDAAAGLEWCGRLNECVDPWVRPCREDFDASIIQRMASVNEAVGRPFSYPEPTIIDWRGYAFDEYLQTDVGGLTMKADNSDVRDSVVEAILAQGFKEDIYNMADGAGSGRMGYVLGNVVCVVEFNAVEFYGPDEPEPDHPISELEDVAVSCGRIE